MNAAGLLEALQAEVACINDVPVGEPIGDYHIGGRELCSHLAGRELAAEEDEQVLLSEADGELSLSVYIDDAVLDRLARADPRVALDAGNLADYCTAMEGVSHFQYLVWNARCGRQVSLLELELQAEVDKYAVAIRTLRRQGRCDLPRGLWRSLFDRVGFVAGLDGEQRRRYGEANRHAANFCRRLDRRFLQADRFRPEAWLRSLRDFYRAAHHAKLRLALS